MAWSTRSAILNHRGRVRAALSWSSTKISTHHSWDPLWLQSALQIHKDISRKYIYDWHFSVFLLLQILPLLTFFPCRCTSRKGKENDAKTRTKGCWGKLTYMNSHRRQYLKNCLDSIYANKRPYQQASLLVFLPPLSTNKH